ncbi:aminotransferase class IV [Arcticibacter tournemirensis]|uniref:branched-chain-amino-acid transaminase n=1 Tax=Arcticibacter tournemirensis TaxID=699437 RepID=A0A4Q0MD32_9SPHI|nr:aminotransferase class IV [Arcticibacter tournemirensis]RXF70716.1 4-amino-4-deoxychorismate lyase [Arcticibacter tournemirensis]
MNFINYNGEIFPANQPVLTTGNRSFKYGDGLFESMRMMRGELRFADLHAERLRNGMKVLGFEGYSLIDETFLKEKVVELAIRNGEGENARVRLTVFRDAEGLYSPLGNKFGYAVEMIGNNETSYTANTKGLIVDVFEDITKPVNCLSNYKTCNSLIYVMAGIFRKQNSLDDVFILNQNGFLCESMSSNVFVLFDKKLYTPSLNEGCIAGVMRSVVMKIAAEIDLPVIEAQINPDILNEAEEVFLTNASRGIQWVMGFNSKRYFNKLSKILMNKLNEG